MTATTTSGSVPQAPASTHDAVGELMTSAEVANLIRIPTATLRYWRHIGVGPRSFKMGPRRVLYRREDIQAWVAGQYAESG